MHLIPTVLLVGALAGGCSAARPLDPLAPAQPFDPARVRIVVPEVFELANIIVAITAYGQSSPTLVLRNGEYYQQVRTGFGPFHAHASMASLQLGTEDPMRRYCELRDNSFAYVYDGDLIKRNPAYKTLWHPNTFRDRLAAMQQFADASQFRVFYAAHAGLYREFVERYRAMAEIDAMADWLELEFAPTRFDHYTVALSPLVFGSHSTHQVNTSNGNEAVMFVSGPEVNGGSGCQVIASVPATAPRL